MASTIDINPATAPGVQHGALPSGHRSKHRVPRELGIVAVLIVIGAVFTTLSKSFLTESDIFNTLLNAAVIALLAMGEAFVLLVAEIDLSVGSLLALTGVGMAEAFSAHFGIVGSILVALALGAGVGLFNGLLVAYTRIPSFIVTFASLGIASSIPLIITQSIPLYISSSSFAFIGQDKVGPVPFPLFLVLGVAIFLAVLLSRSLFGRRIYAIGGNREAARLSGIGIRGTIVWVFVVSGLVAGLAGAIEAGRLSAGYPTAGSTTELFDAIAGAVVGGVSLFGGIGTVAGALIGALIIGTLEQGLDVLNVSTYWQPLVIGAVILIGVWFDSVTRRQGGGPGLRELLVRRFGQPSSPSPEGTDAEVVPSAQGLPTAAVGRDMADENR